MRANLSCKQWNYDSDYSNGFKAPNLLDLNSKAVKEPTYPAVAESNV
ncbi:outer membrane cobalamin receptor [Cytobacillus purgationiresistens]|uniref:Outer membrane cobalamin receptor n=1 Tax=Cytobacillus purgationiresistens TaxID=863449 RepID=A0ABU0AKF8_9BACI|nr:outer membrane cobalamin receptor [Cytobacillus purgationiresistens]